MTIIAIVPINDIFRNEVKGTESFKVEKIEVVDTSPSIRAVRLYLATWDIETNNYDISARNDSTNAKGALQITNVCIEDANRILQQQKYDTLSVFDPVKATEIWLIIQNNYNPNFNTLKGASRWIAGRNRPHTKYAKYYVKRIHYLIRQRYGL